MAFLRKKPADPIAVIELGLADLQARRTALVEQLVASSTEVEAATAERRRFLVEGELVADDQRREIDRRVVHAQASEIGLQDAIEQLNGKITAAEGRLAAERDRLARQVEIEQRSRQATYLAEALATFTAAAPPLVAALRAITDCAIEAAGLAQHVEAATADIAVAITAQAAGLRSYCAAVGGGAAMRKQGTPVAAPPLAPPAPDVPRQRVYTLQRSRWREPTGEVMTAAQYSEINLPADIARRAITLNLVDDVSSQRAVQLREMFGVDWSRPGIDECTDLETGERPVVEVGMLGQPVIGPARAMEVSIERR
jgi:hypothetical protein